LKRAASVLDNTVRKLNAVLAELDRIRVKDYPQPHTEEGLRLIELLVDDYLASLGELSDRSGIEVVHGHCEEMLDKIVVLLPLIGFLLRSTNIRNSFEAHGPLARLACDVVGEQAKLVISSEWEFSPFVEMPTPQLPGFILIGLPASESGNGLIVPLAGHELGHPVWTGERLKDEFDERLGNEIASAIEARWSEYEEHFDGAAREKLGDPAGRDHWSPALTWAHRQAEESFCDFLGLRIFSESFLHAFGFLLAPETPDQSRFYPSLRTRADNLVKAATAYSIPVPDGFVSQFNVAKSPWDERTEFLLSLVRNALDALVPDLIERCSTFADERGLGRRDNAEIKKARADLELLVPASEMSQVQSVLNAAWQVHVEDDVWCEYQDVLERKDEILNELLLKSFEVNQIEAYLQSSPNVAKG